MKLSKKNILVTGAAGFIGSHLSDALSLLEINKLVLVDNMFLGQKKNLELTKKNNPNVKEYLDKKFSIAKYEVIEDIIDQEEIDIVFDLATIPLPASLTDPKWCFEEITSMAVNLCELCRLGKFETLIHCSTSEVYGTSEFVPMNEDHPWNSRTAYAAAKGASDLCIKSYVSTFEIDAVIIRPFNNYGPRQNDANYAGVIPIFSNNLLNNNTCTIFGDGNQTRDFIYVTDTAKGIIEIAESSYEKGEVINLASGKEVSIKELGDLLYKTKSKKFDPVFEEKRPGDVDRHLAGTQRLKDLTGFKPEVSIDEGLSNTLDWYENK